MKWTPMQPVEVGDRVVSGRSGPVEGIVVKVEVDYLSKIDGKRHKFLVPIVTVEYDGGRLLRKPLSRWHLVERRRKE